MKRSLLCNRGTNCALMVPKIGRHTYEAGAMSRHSTNEVLSKQSDAWDSLTMMTNGRREAPPLHLISVQEVQRRREKTETESAVLFCHHRLMNMECNTVVVSRQFANKFCWKLRHKSGDEARTNATWRKRKGMLEMSQKRRDGSNGMPGSTHHQVSNYNGENITRGAI